MSFEEYQEPLKQAFTDIFARRPKNVTRAANTPAIVKPGSNEPLSLHGEYLEGVSNSDIILRSSSDRITIQDIQKSGEFENTAVEAVLNASPGADESNISIEGYTWGQDNNATAKFTVNDAINIEDSDPVLEEVEAYAFNYLYPESIQFICTATENVTTILLTIEGQIHEYRGMEFVYTCKTSGYIPATLQGRTDDGQLTNQINITIVSSYRPSIEGITVRARYEDYSNMGNLMVPYWIAATGEYVLSAWQTGIYVPVIGVSMSWTEGAGFFPAYINLNVLMNQGGLGFPIVKPLCYTYANGPIGVGAYQYDINNTKLTLRSSVVGVFTYVYIIYYPKTSAGTLGAPMELCFKCYTNPKLVVTENPNYSAPAAAIPSTNASLLSLNGFPTSSNAYGGIIGYNDYTSNIAGANMLTSALY